MRILIIDDDVINRAKTVKILTDLNHEVIESINPDNALKLCRQHCPHCIIVNEVISGHCGERLITQLRHTGGGAAWVPIILTSNSMSNFQMQRALRAGASGVLVKPIDAIQLQFYIADAKRLLSMQEQTFSVAHDLVEATSRIENHITQDVMTGMLDINSFHHKLIKEYQIAKQKHTDLSLLLLDLDCFREYNNKYGSILGDRRIIEVAEALTKQLPHKTEVMARTTGETFAVLMPETNKTAALSMGNILCELVDKLGITHSGSCCSDHLTASVGVTTFADEYLEDPLEIIEAADHALYYAKHAGRNQVCFEKVHTMH